MNPSGEVAGVRFAPPAPTGRLIDRPALVEVLGGRFDRRLTVLSAGAGFGKTTLLHQALSDRAGHQTGLDVWVDLAGRAAAHSSIDDLVVDRLSDLTKGAVRRGSSGSGSADSQAVLKAVWQLAPRSVCLVFDNLHAYGDQEDLARFIELVANELPANGSLVLSSRHLPPLPLEGDVVVLEESDLAFDEAATARFAQLWGLNPADLGQSGWPAMLELRATAGLAAERDYIEQEVLDGLGPERLWALRRLAPLGRFDDALIRAATGLSMGSTELARGLPLTSRTADGTVVLHDMWSTMLPPLDPAELAEACAAIADELAKRDQLPSALSMYARAGQLQRARELLRPIACDYALKYRLSERREMLSAVPEELEHLPETELIKADLVFATQPSASASTLELAARSARQAAEAELEAQALLRLAELQYRSDDNAGLTSIAARLDELADADPVPVVAVRSLVEVWSLMASDSYPEALSVIETKAMDRYPPTSTHAEYYRAVIPGLIGHARLSLEALDDVMPRLNGRHRSRALGHESIMRFYLGELDDDGRAAIWKLVQGVRSEGHTHLFIEGACTTAIYHLVAGRLDDARHQFEQARAEASGFSDASWARHLLALVEAGLAAFDGDEESATQILDSTMPAGGPFAGLTRHVYYNLAALVYVLLPRSRPHWDADDCGPAMRFAREVGRALVAVRERGDFGPAATLPWNDLERIRTWAIEPHLAELAVAAVSAGNELARSIVGELRHDPHAALTEVGARHDQVLSDSAGALLAATPRRPESRVTLSVLGPTVVEAAGRTVAGMRMRRRVLELLHLLVARRRVSRAHVLEAIWPDLDRSKALNNLRVNLNHLNRILEPEREAKAPPWHVRREGDHIVLVGSRFLSVDAELFDNTCAVARLADNSGDPVAAIDGYLEACTLYRGDFLFESSGGDIGIEDRERYRIEFVSVATRCSELMTAGGRADEATELSARAVAADPLSSDAYRAHVAALFETGRRAEARAKASECQATFEREGLEAPEFSPRIWISDGAGRL